MSHTQLAPDIVQLFVCFSSSGYRGTAVVALFRRHGAGRCVPLGSKEDACCQSCPTLLLSYVGTTDRRDPSVGTHKKKKFVTAMRKFHRGTFWRKSKKSTRAKSGELLKRSLILHIYTLCEEN